MDFFTSDTHFNHHTDNERNIIKFCARPYNNVHDMNEDLIRRWNSVVTPEDTVYHLGDFALGDSSLRQDIFNRLNGRKRLIEGNHDNKVTRELGWDSVDKRDGFTIMGTYFQMVHNPAHATVGASDSTIPVVVLHGHLHGMSELHPFDKVERYTYFDVGVDVHNYTPITLNQIITLINEGK